MAAGSLTILVVLLVGKALAYAVSLGCGFRGGPIFPAIFVGVDVASFAVVLCGMADDDRPERPAGAPPAGARPGYGDGNAVKKCPSMAPSRRISTAAKYG